MSEFEFLEANFSMVIKNHVGRAWLPPFFSFLFHSPRLVWWLLKLKFLVGKWNREPHIPLFCYLMFCLHSHQKILSTFIFIFISLYKWSMAHIFGINWTVDLALFFSSGYQWYQSNYSILFYICVYVTCTSQNQIRVAMKYHLILITVLI